jgi:hypothetical protein
MDLKSRCRKKIKKRSGIAPLQLLTLASFRTWGIQQELVVPLGHKGKAKIMFPKQNSNKSLLPFLKFYNSVTKLMAAFLPHLLGK